MHGGSLLNWQRFLAGIAGEWRRIGRGLAASWLVKERVLERGKTVIALYIYLKPRLTRPHCPQPAATSFFHVTRDVVPYPFSLFRTPSNPFLSFLFHLTHGVCEVELIVSNDPWWLSLAWRQEKAA